jgi:hypothetical protein
VPGAAGQVVVVDVFSGDFDHGLPIGMVDGQPAVLRLPAIPVLGNGPGTETEASGFRTGYGYGVYGSRLVSFETGLRRGAQGPDGTYWTWKQVADRLVPVLSPHACVLAAGTAQPRC